MYRNSVLTLFVLLILLTSCSKKIAPPTVLGIVPTQSQIEWFNMEYYGFIHFGPNTFTGNEWGDGQENPKLFNPTSLDTDQWAKVCKEAGMSGVILTAKHHDGFCLWPSRQSTHTVRESQWLNGRGDILKMLSESCQKYGLKLGIYLSPWDMNHPDFATPRYNDVYIKTIEEVLTNYGEIFEFWYDGGDTGRDGKKQIYDWDRFDATIRKLQPKAAINGCRDLRWVGNEHGYAPETCWATITRDSVTAADKRGDGSTLSLLANGMENGEQWSPAECDVSIRPGWFHRNSENSKVKSTAELFDIYMGSVGRNATLILNLAPDSRGLIPDTEIKRLKELKAHIDECFDKNLALGTKITSTNSRPDPAYSAAKAINNNKHTYWATDDSVRCASLTFEWLTPQSINAVMLQEYIALGQRIRSFNVEIFMDENWMRIAEGTTVGRKRIVTFDRVETSKIRINITDSKEAITISNVGIYDFPMLMTVPSITRSAEGLVSIGSEIPNAKIYYTTNQSKPEPERAILYTEPFEAMDAIVIKAITVDPTDDNKRSEIVTEQFGIMTKDWKIVGNDSRKQTHPAINAIDANPTTIWMSESENAKHPHNLTIDMTREHSISGFTYLPRQDGSKIGNVSECSVYVSVDNEVWDCVAEHRKFNNIANNPIEQEVYFAAPVSARYIRFETHNDSYSLENSESKGVAAVAELGVITVEINK